MKHPRILLLDLDGVLRRWSPADAGLERLHGLPRGSIRSVAFAEPLISQAITGAITDEKWRRCIGERLASQYPEARAVEAVHAWSLPIGEVCEDVRSLLATTALPIVLVTNATTRLNRDLEALGIAGMFKAIVNSSEIGAAKPSSRIFERALAWAGAEPSEVLFIDDTLCNVAAARKLGIPSLHFERYEQLAVILSRSENAA